MPSMPAERISLCSEMMNSVAGAKYPAVHFSTWELHPSHHLSLHKQTQSQATIDAHYPSTTADWTQADLTAFLY